MQQSTIPLFFQGKRKGGKAILPEQKKKKRKGSEKNSMEAGAAVFSRSLWS